MPNLMAVSLHDPITNLDIMKSRMLFFGLLLGICVPRIQAQDIDVTQLMADTKTFIFSNNKNTVKGYIYAELEEKTSCCGSDRIYLEVRIDPSGYVTQAKTLTGKNECFKQAAIDIVKNVKWDAKDFKREKSVYFEIKPEIDCESGSRANNYAQVEIFNNELLDKEGNRTGAVATTSQPAATTPKPAEVASANISTPASQPAAKQPEPAKTTTPPATQPAAVATTTPKPAATTTPAPKQPIAANDGQMRSNSTPPAATPSSESDFVKAKERVELERNVQDEEIRILKEQMEAARAREEAAREREKQLKEEQARREREREEREKARQNETKDSFASSNGEGGLFFDESTNDNSSTSMTDQGGDGRTQGGDPAASAEQRAQDDIRRLEQQMREIEERNRQRENELRAKERDDQLAAQEMLRIREEILRKQEEMERNREQQELDRIAQDRRRAEEEQRKYEEEVRRMMDEIARLQAESERKMQELQRQKEEMDRLAQLQIQREQEQVLQGQIREKQREAELAAMRMSVQGSRSLAPSTPTASTATTLPANFTIPSSDSAKLDMILMQMGILQQELIRVQTEMANLRAGGGITPINSPVNTPRGATTPTRTATPASGGAKNAAQDDRWKKIDTGVPGGSRGGASSVVDPGRFDPVRGYSPAMSNPDSHENLAISRFPSPTSGQGQGNMKNYIKEELRKRGVCGLAQALAEITINPKGDVVSYNVIKANDLTVSSALPGILQGMKFEPSELDVPYVSYIEFKADLLCEGQERINIREVDDYIDERP